MGRSLGVRPLAACQARKQRVEHRRTPKIMPKLQPPAIRQSKSIDEGEEQRNVTEAKANVLETRAAHGLDREQRGLDIGGLLVFCAEAFDARLAELTRVSLSVAVWLKT